MSQHVDNHVHNPNGSHSHKGLLGKNSELIFSIVCGVLLAVGFAISFIHEFPSWVSLIFYLGAYFFGGFYFPRQIFNLFFLFFSILASIIKRYLGTCFRNSHGEIGEPL